MMLQFCFLFQSIPADMEFDPDSNPPCYKTKDEVRTGFFSHQILGNESTKSFPSFEFGDREIQTCLQSLPRGCGNLPAILKMATI